MIRARPDGAGRAFTRTRDGDGAWSGRLERLYATRLGALPDAHEELCALLRGAPLAELSWDEELWDLVRDYEQDLWLDVRRVVQTSSLRCVLDHVLLRRIAVSRPACLHRRQN